MLEMMNMIPKYAHRQRKSRESLSTCDEADAAKPGAIHPDVREVHYRDTCYCTQVNASSIRCAPTETHHSMKNGFDPVNTIPKSTPGRPAYYVFEIFPNNPRKCNLPSWA